MKKMKWVGIAFAVLALLIVLAAAVIYVVGGSRFNQTYTFADEDLVVPNDSLTVSRGRHLVRTHACAECHGEDLGGKLLVDGMPFARISASNLTSGKGGIGQTYTDADWEKALRHGVNPAGRGLLIMPADLYTHLADDDLVAMIAYLKTLPPVDQELPPTTLGLVGRMVATFNPMTMPQLMTTPVEPPAQAPLMGATVAYGKYRASTLCIACHGPQLAGAPHPDPAGPFSPDLLRVKDWTLEEFSTALRGGVTPDGRSLDPHWMPWPHFSHLRDAEVEGIYRYIQTLPASAAEPLDAR